MYVNYNGQTSHVSNYFYGCSIWSEGLFGDAERDQLANFLVFVSSVNYSALCLCHTDPGTGSKISKVAEDAVTWYLKHYFTVLAENSCKLHFRSWEIGLDTKLNV